jgi:hypothetical protein
VRLLGISVDSPQVLAGRIVGDLAAVAGLARSAPARLDRLLELGEEIAEIARNVLAIAERLDARTEAAIALGERLDQRIQELIELGDRVQKLGQRVDERGAEIVDRANRVNQTGAELIAVLPAFERAVEMATPLEGAIDRFGRLVDRLPGGTARRRAEQAAETAADARRQAKEAAAAADGSE